MKGNCMDEVITTKNGSFGYIRVSVPMNIKETMLTWLKKSGMGRAEFFRVALMIGVNHLAESINAKTKGENFNSCLEGRKEDGLS